MGFVVLIQLARVPAEATVERLAGLGIEARLLDDPNLFTKGSTGGRYLVRVSVDEQNLERFKRGERFDHFGPGVLTSYFTSTFELPLGAAWSFVIENPLDESVFVHYRIGDDAP